jgi:hypothetical protein
VGQSLTASRVGSGRVSVVREGFPGPGDTVSGRVSDRWCRPDRRVEPKLTERSQLYAFITAAVFLLKVIWLLPSTYDTTQIFQEVEAVIETFRAVSGQLHAHFLAQILKHVRSHHHEAQMRVPTLMPTASEYASTALASSHPGKSGIKANGAGHLPLPFNPFETSLAGVEGHAQGNPGSLAHPTAAANGTGLGQGDEVNGSGLPGPDVFGEPENDFWSWLQSEGQSFSPLVNTLDTFDSSIAMGGL